MSNRPIGIYGIANNSILNKNSNNGGGSNTDSNTSDNTSNTNNNSTDQTGTNGGTSSGNDNENNNDNQKYTVTIGNITPNTNRTHISYGLRSNQSVKTPITSGQSISYK